MHAEESGVNFVGLLLFFIGIKPIIVFWQVKQMLIALLCESEMKLTDETIEMILDKVSILAYNLHMLFAVSFYPFSCSTVLLITNCCLSLIFVFFTVFKKASLLGGETHLRTLITPRHH